MGMKRLSLTKAGKGGGFYGADRVCAWRNWRAAEHGLVKHGPDGVTVIEEFPPQCMLGVDVYAERTEVDGDDFPQFVTQWYGIGQLPLARLGELGWPINRLQQSVLKGPGGQKQWEQRLRNPGGFQPLDGNNNSVSEGAFFGSETEDGFYKGSGWGVLKDELINLANASGEDLEDRLNAHGLAVLDGLVAKAGLKELPKSKTAIAKEKLTGEEKDARRILVPVEVDEWPWKASSGTGTAASAPVAAQPAPAKPKAAPKAVAAAPARPAGAAVPAPTPAPMPIEAPADGEPSAQDYEVADVVVAALTKLGGSSVAGAGGGLNVKVMGVLSASAKDYPLFQALGRPGLTTYMQRAQAVLPMEPFNGALWNYEPSTGKVELIKGE